jgi:RNA polymerase sigma-70 factor (ECF subfamily)
MPDWHEIMGRDGPAVWQTAYRLLGNRADADECFQEAFLAALEVSRRGPVRDWRALLKHLAANRAVDRLRERSRRAARQEAADWGSVPGPAPPPSRAAEDAELAARLRDALARVPPKQAEAFCLHCLEGWSYQEVAARLAVSVDAVGVLLHRARARLRGLMAEALGAPRPGGRGPDAGATGPRKEGP